VPADLGQLQTKGTGWECEAYAGFATVSGLGQDMAAAVSPGKEECGPALREPGSAYPGPLILALLVRQGDYAPQAS